MEQRWTAPESFKIQEPYTWEKWKQRFQVFLLASGKKKADEDEKIAILLHTMGSESLDIYNTFDQTKVKTLDELILAFDTYFLPKKNTTMETFKFNNIVQKEDQSIDSFITELKKQASHCDFVCEKAECKQSYEARMIRDRVVLGVNNKNVQQRLLRESAMSLDKIREYCQSVEISKQHMGLLAPESSEEEVNAIKTTKSCGYCGKTHLPRKCPAYNKICTRCKKRNHFATMCRSKEASTTTVNALESDEQQAHALNIEHFTINSPEEKNVNKSSDNVSNENIFIQNCSGTSTKDSKCWYESLYINNKLLKLKLDTAADSSVISSSHLKDLGVPKSKIVTSAITVVSFGNFKSKPLGYVTLRCSYKDKIENVKFLVVNFKTEPLLGLKDCLSFGLIARVNNISLKASNNKEYLPKTKDEFCNNFASLFDGLGTMPGFINLKLKPEAKPVIQTQRRVPLALHTKLKTKLDELLTRNIISKVDYPTDWVNAMMLVEKSNGSLRICLDPRPLNKYLCRSHYTIPKGDDIISTLEGKRLFTVIDMKDGFWQLCLDEQSSNLCTFSTPFGRYKFNRLPFGISVAPEIFQRKNMDIFGDIPNVKMYFDDLIIAGSDEREHDIALRRVIERALQFGIKFNISKIQYKVSTVNFLGQIISSAGVQPNTKNIEAVLAIEIPNNKKELLRILGLFKFFSKFIPNLAQLTANMRNLTKNNVDFTWNTCHQKELDYLKTLITNRPLLKLYDEKKSTVIQTDASSQGLGCVLLQDSQPIAFASRSLNSSEVKYAQIEKEMLSIVFACEKFHHFIYGREVEIHTDHKPLIPIFKKDLNELSMRLQRMRLRLLKYRITPEYIPGKEMYVADALSRSYIKSTVPIDEEIEFLVHSLSINVPMSDEKKLLFKNVIANDLVLKNVKNFCETQWPAQSKNLSKDLQFYYKLKDNIHLSDGMLFYDFKVIIPYSLRKDMLKLIHEPHFGIQKSKLRAREVMYWPNMSSDIEQFVAKCEICQLNRPANTKEPLKPHALPERPWQFLYSDLLEHERKNYFLLVDAYSHWLEVIEIKDKTALTVINKCKDIFSRFGVPDTFFADNVPYNSVAFKNFASEWNFNLEYSSPEYHQSNGMAEKHVDIAKRMLRKMNSKSSLSEVLMEFRNTAIPSLGYSPAQLLLNRIIKTKMPTALSHLQPKIVDRNNIKEKLVNNSVKQKSYYDLHARKLPLIHSGDKVLFQKNNKWERGEIVDKYNDRSFIVKDMHGTNFRRNRRLINKTNIPFNKVLNNDDNIVYEDVELDSPSNLDDGLRAGPEIDSDSQSSDLSVYLSDDNSNYESNDDSYSSSSETLNDSNSDNTNGNKRVVKRPNHLKDYLLY